MGKADRFRMGNILYYHDCTATDPEALREILSVEEIDLNATLSILNGAYTAAMPDCQSIDTTCNSYNEIMVGSRRFETGETAQAQKRKMDDIQTETTRLQQGLTELVSGDTIENFTEKINEYNDILGKMKLYAKAKLIQLKMVEVNNKAQNGTGIVKVAAQRKESTNSEPRDHISNGIYYKITGVSVRTPDNKRREYTYTETGYAYFEDANNLKPLYGTPETNQSIISNGESAFGKLGIELPY